jgi:hypothetical protein
MAHLVWRSTRALTYCKILISRSSLRSYRSAYHGLEEDGHTSHLQAIHTRSCQYGLKIFGCMTEQQAIALGQAPIGPISKHWCGIHTGFTLAPFGLAIYPVSFPLSSQWEGGLNCTKLCECLTVSRTKYNMAPKVTENRFYPFHTHI